MKWAGRRQSSNVEDQRGGGMGRGALPVGGGIGTVVLALAYYLFTGDSRPLQQVATPTGGQTTTQRGANPQVDVQGDESARFVSTVLADTEDVWGELFRQRGLTYREPKLVLFTDRVESACGIAGSSSGPFYCPEDQKLYLDLAFFREMRSRLGAPGDFAQAYVIAHEVGHHVQNLRGTLEQSQRLQARASKAEANQISVQTELQADFYAGVWAHHAAKRNLLETGDVEEALNAASAVGDDRLQESQRGYSVPDSFTHGTSAQRVESFSRGLKSGDPREGNIFR